MIEELKLVDHTHSYKFTVSLTTKQQVHTL